MVAEELQLVLKMRMPVTRTLRYSSAEFVLNAATIARGSPMKGMSHDDRQKASARESDVRKSSQAQKVSSVEKVGGPTGVRFGVHDHPDKSVVTKGKLAQ